MSSKKKPINLMRGIMPSWMIQNTNLFYKIWQVFYSELYHGLYPHILSAFLIILIRKLRTLEHFQVCTGVSKGELPYGRLNEGSPEGGEIRNLPPLAGSLPTFLLGQESRPPEAWPGFDDGNESEQRTRLDRLLTHTIVCCANRAAHPGG